VYVCVSCVCERVRETVCACVKEQKLANGVCVYVCV